MHYISTSEMARNNLLTLAITLVCLFGFGVSVHAQTASCVGQFVPQNAHMFPGDDQGLTQNHYTGYSPTDTEAKCQYTCNEGYIWDLATWTCNPPGGVYTCAGSIPANAAMWDAEETVDLNFATSWDEHSIDTPVKCQYTCNSGYMYNGSSCISTTCQAGYFRNGNNCFPIAPRCAGRLPPGAVVYEGDYDVTADTPFVHNPFNTSAKCEFSCGEDYTWDGVSDCKAWAPYCKGTIPANAEVYSGDDIGIQYKSNFVFSGSDTSNKCEFGCKTGYTYTASSNTCNTISGAVNSCTGTLPANTTAYSGDETGLTTNTARTYSAAGTSAKCEFSCNTGYTWNGSVCMGPTGGEEPEYIDPNMCTLSISIPNMFSAFFGMLMSMMPWRWNTDATTTIPPTTYSCAGTLPANTTAYSGDETGLTTNTARTYSAAGTSAKCEFSCNTGYTWNGSACVTPPSPTTCSTGYILHNGLCKPRMMDLTASSDPKFYLGNTLTALRTWRDWKDYAPLVKKVAELTAGKTDDFEKAKAILNWTQTSKAYACPELYAQCPDSPANNNAEFSTIFDSDIGVCLDAAIISTAMLRVAGISATPRMISVGHIVTLFYANGLWYSADATFSTNRATAGQVDIANAAEARNRFLPFVAGEIESDMKLNGLYCDNEFCMGIPFRANRVLSNSGVKTTQITFPAMTIAEYDLKTRNQVLCTLKTRGVVSDVLGSFVTIYENNPWQSAEVAYFIGDGAAQDTPYGNVPVGYITANVPVGSAAETENKIEYRFECHRGYAWGVDSGKPIAYKEVIPRLGENVTISYSDMIKDTSASDEEFAKVIALVKASTEDLGIYPDSPITESLADPASRE